MALAGVLLLRPFSAVPSAAAARDELRAARMMETALFARQAGAAEWKKLDRAYAELSAKYPDDATIKNAHGEFLWTRGEHARAVQAWLAAEEIEPGNAVVLDHLGGSFLAAGDAKKAASYYVRAARSSPANAAYHFNYANVAFLFRHELLDPGHPDADSLLRDALAHFAEAARLQPLDPDYARAYAETYYTVPDPDWRAALRAWQHFYEISPQKDFALLNLARVHMKLGNKPEARESLARIQGPEFRGLKTRLQERIEAE
jgi:Tfp pilus assembly protein PilF